MQSRSIAVTSVLDPLGHSADVFHVDDELGLYIVCDSLPGNELGEIAASTAIESIASFVGKRIDLFDQACRTYCQSSELVTLVRELIQDANNELWFLSQNSSRFRDLTTSVVMVLLRRDVAIVIRCGSGRVDRVLDWMVQNPAQQRHRIERIVPGPDGAADMVTPATRQKLGQPTAPGFELRLIRLHPSERLLISSQSLDSFVESPETQRLLQQADHQPYIGSLLEGLAAIESDCEATSVLIDIKPPETSSVRGSVTGLFSSRGCKLRPDKTNRSITNVAWMH